MVVVKNILHLLQFNDSGVEPGAVSMKLPCSQGAHQGHGDEQDAVGDCQGRDNPIAQAPSPEPLDRAPFCHSTSALGTPLFNPSIADLDPAGGWAVAHTNLLLTARVAFPLACCTHGTRSSNAAAHPIKTVRSQTRPAYLHLRFLLFLEVRIGSSLASPTSGQSASEGSSKAGSGTGGSGAIDSHG